MLLIFRSSCTHVFQNRFKNFAILVPLFNKVAGLLLHYMVAASGYSWQQILFFSWIWYLLLTVAPAFVPGSHRTCSVKKGVLRNFGNFTGKNLCGRSTTLLKETPTQSSSVEFANFLKTANLKSANDCFWNLFFHLDCPF